jgi:hypothetical protein
MSSSEAILATLSTVVLIVLGLSSAAVAWHRLLLLGEPPPLLYLRLGGQVPRYVGRFFVIILIVAAVQLFCAALLWSLGVRVTSPSSDVSPSAEHALLQILVGLIVQVVVILITTRLSISLPGIAVGRPMTLHEAWHATRGHAWRLFGGTLLVWAPSVVFLFLLELSGAGNNILAAVLLLCALFFCTVAAISFISLSYRFFEGAPQPVEP